MTHPGPWTYYRDKNERGDHLPSYTIATPADAEHYARIARTFDGCGHYSTEADAALIAAAPDLLQACEMLVEIGDHEAWLDLDDTIKVARDAVAKAAAFYRSRRQNPRNRT